MDEPSTPIRVATNEDVAGVLEIYRPFVESSSVSFEIELPSHPEMEQRIRDCLRGFPWLVLGPVGEVHGYAYAGLLRTRAAYQWSCEVSTYVGEGHRQGGVGRRLYEALFRILTRQGYRNVYAGVTLPNPASLRFHEALGFEPVGVYRRIGFKFGNWHDVGWWQRHLGDERPPSEPPTAFSAMGAAEIRAALEIPIG